MDNNNKHRNLLAYINTPMSKESIMMMYDAHNVRFEKCELYNDFVQSLLRLSFDTYMGDEVTDIDQQTNHFDWCWKKNIENFTLEGIRFDSSKLYDYFLEYMLEVFYSSDKKEIEHVDRTCLKMWRDIFDYNRIKTSSDMDTFIEVYKIFENSLKIG